MSGGGDRIVRQSAGRQPSDFGNPLIPSKLILLARRMRVSAGVRTPALTGSIFQIQFHPTLWSPGASPRNKGKKALKQGESSIRRFRCTSTH